MVEDNIKRVYILVGIPGSGKSTWIKNNIPGIGTPATVIASADHFFERNGEYKWEANKVIVAHRVCQRTYMKALENQTVRTIVLDNTNVKSREVKDYITQANRFGIIPTMVFIVCDPEIAILRNKHNVPAHTIRNMAQAMKHLMATHSTLEGQHNQFTVDNTNIIIKQQ